MLRNVDENFLLQFENVFKTQYTTLLLLDFDRSNCKLVNDPAVRSVVVCLNDRMYALFFGKHLAMTASDCSETAMREADNTDPVDQIRDGLQACIKDDPELHILSAKFDALDVVVCSGYRSWPNQMPKPVIYHSQLLSKCRKAICLVHRSFESHGFRLHESGDREIFRSKGTNLRISDLHVQVSTCFRTFRKKRISCLTAASRTGFIKCSMSFLVAESVSLF